MNAVFSAFFVITAAALSSSQYYSPISERFLTNSNVQRSDSCPRRYPGSSCMSLFSCLASGGTIMDSCDRGTFTTCCISSPASRNFPRWTNRNIQEITPKSTRRNVSNSSRDFMQNVMGCGTPKPMPQSRIVGGHDALYGEFPWQAHIKLNRQQCGGVLLNNYYVLTAAHCIYEVRLKDIAIQLGLYDVQDHSRQRFPPQTFSVVEKKIHPKFKYQHAHPDRYDVALLKLDKAAKYNENVLPICLPQKDWNFLGWTATITGWGKTDPAAGDRFGTRILQKVEVPIISNKQCEEWHHMRGIDIKISSEMMCAGYEDGKKDACVGDSGGPLTVIVNGRWTLAGLVSAGFGCAQQRQPGIYHRTSNSVEWIRTSILS